MRRILLTALALFVASTLAPAASAGELAGVSMADQVTVGDDTLVLNGMGLRKKFIIKVYVAGLYLPAKTKDAAKVMADDEARRTVMHFLYGVSDDQLCEAWDEGLEANTPGASAEVTKKFADLCGMMESIEKGQQMVLTYVPGTGTRVEVNGKAKGTVEGPAFARALWATWVGPKPGPGEDFKKALLGG
jgi:hypothetical protein